MRKNPIINFIYTIGVKYPTPTNLNYFYNFGVFALVALVIQIITGILLLMLRVPTIEIAFIIIEHTMRDKMATLALYIYRAMCIFFLFCLAVAILPTIMYLEGWSGSNLIMKALSTTDNDVATEISPTEPAIHDTPVNASSTESGLNRELLPWESWIFLKYKPSRDPSDPSVAGLVDTKTVPRTLHDTVPVSKVSHVKCNVNNSPCDNGDVNYNHEKSYSILEGNVSRGSRYYFNNYRDYFITGSKVKGFRDTYFFMSPGQRAHVDGFIDKLVPVEIILDPSTNIETEISAISQFEDINAKISTIPQYADSLLKAHSIVSTRVDAILTEFKYEVSLMTKDHADALCLELKHLRQQQSILNDYINDIADTLYSLCPAKPKT